VTIVESTSSNGARAVLLIRGLGGYLQDEAFRLRYGETATIGRSRRCRLSLRRGRRFREGNPEIGLKDPDFLRVSREHLEISYPHPGMVEVRNLSRNGIFLDGNRVDRVILTDLDRRDCRIRFGGKEILGLSFENHADGTEGRGGGPPAGVGGG
jgi:hypothetical protein